MRKKGVFFGWWLYNITSFYRLYCRCGKIKFNSNSHNEKKCRNYNKELASENSLSLLVSLAIVLVWRWELRDNLRTSWQKPGMFSVFPKEYIWNLPLCWLRTSQIPHSKRSPSENSTLWWELLLMRDELLFFYSLVITME